MKRFPWLWLAVMAAITSRACIWDADTLSHEKSRSKDLASAILGEAPVPDDAEKLRARITELNAHRNEASAEWWDNLAGAYLRLNQPAEAVKILEPVVGKFTNDYGVHANLGTAYHLLGRYAEAEKEIARDLAINPNAHFGFEKYHLALLQFLVRETKYQSRHVYVDELTVPFLMAYKGRIDPWREREEMAADDARAGFTNGLAEAESALAQITGTNFFKWDDGTFRLLAEVSTFDVKPDYRTKWNLAEDTNFEGGVIYMAQMNPKEPACFTMLGVAAWKKRDYNLAVKAFEKAIALNSPQTDLLSRKIEGLNYYVNESLTQERAMGAAVLVPAICLALFCVLCIYAIIRRLRHKPARG